MERNAFFKAIKSGSLSGAYLLHGAEEYIKDAALAAATGPADAPARELNIDFPPPNADAVIAACETMPFLAEKRTVIVRAMPDGPDSAALIRYIGEVPPTTLLLFFIRGTVDGRLAFVKAMRDAGREVEFRALEAYEASQWLMQQAAKRNVTLGKGEADFFTALSGTDCYTLSGELDKAAAYVGQEGTVTKAVISTVATRNVESVIFSIIDQLLARRPKEAFEALENLLDAGQSALSLASFLSTNLMYTLEARRMIERKADKAAVVARLGRSVSPGYAGSMFRAASRISPSLVPAATKTAKALSSAITLTLTSSGANDTELIRDALMILAVG